MAMNTALKVAFVETGKKQIVVASQLGIHDSRLSKIINGHIEPTDTEKRALSKALRRPVGDLFPEMVA